MSVQVLRSLTAATAAVSPVPASESFKEQVRDRQLLTALHSLAAISRQEPALLKELNGEIASLFMQLGHFFYGSHLPAARVAFMASSYLLGGRNEDPNVKLIYEACFQEKTLEELAIRLENLRLSFNEQPLTAPADLKDKFLFALATRWLGHAEQKSGRLADLNELYQPSLVALDELREQTDDPVIQRDADWEYGQLCYHSDRPLHELAPVPNDQRRIGISGYFSRCYKPYIERDGKSERGAAFQAKLDAFLKEINPS